MLHSNLYFHFPTENSVNRARDNRTETETEAERERERSVGIWFKCAVAYP